jgi:hypothetical protein
MRLVIFSILIFAVSLVRAGTGCAADSCVHIRDVDQVGASTTTTGETLSVEVWEVPIRFCEKKSDGKVLVRYPSEKDVCLWESCSLDAGTIPTNTESVILVISLFNGEPRRWALLF